MQFLGEIFPNVISNLAQITMSWILCLWSSDGVCVRSHSRAIVAVLAFLQPILLLCFQNIKIPIRW